VQPRGLLRAREKWKMKRVSAERFNNFFDNGKSLHRSTPTDVAFRTSDQERAIFPAIRDDAVQHDLSDDCAVRLRRFGVHRMSYRDNANRRVSGAGLSP